MHTRTRTHAKQTEDEINTFLLNHFKISPSEIGSSVKKAHDAIIKVNKFVNDSAGTEKDVGAAHFDEEFFFQGQTRLMNLRSEMIAALKTIDATSATSLFGRQLHKLQDFYTHSNWVEMGNTAINDIIGVPEQTRYPSTAPGLKTCKNLCQTPNPAYLTSLKCVDGLKKE